MNQDENKIYGDEPFREETKTLTISESNRKSIGHSIKAIISVLLFLGMCYIHWEDIYIIPNTLLTLILVALVLAIMIFPIRAFLWRYRGKNEPGSGIALLMLIIALLLVTPLLIIIYSD